VCRRLVAAGVVTFACLAVVLPAVAQAPETSPAPTPAPTPQPTPTPIPPSDIPTRAADAADVARDAVAHAAPDARLRDIQQRFPDEQTRIDQLRADTTKRLSTPGPASVIKETENSLARVRDRLDRWLKDLATRSGALDTTLEDLGERISLWRLTRDHREGAALPRAVVGQIADTIKTLSDAESQVRNARDAILDLQASVARERSEVDRTLAAQEEEIARRSRGVLAADSPPLWKAFGAEADSGDVRGQFQELQHEHRRSLNDYVSEQGSGLLVWLLIWCALALLMGALQGKAAVWVQQDRSLQTAVSLLGRPASTALIVTALLNMVLEPQAPSAWGGAVGLVLALALLRVLVPLLPDSLRPAPFLAMLLFLLRQAVRLTPDGSGLYRLALLALGAGGLAVCVWLIRTVRARPGILSEAWSRAVLIGARAALVLFGFGTAANVFGVVDFSRLVLTGTTRAALGAVLIVVAAATLRSMVRVVLLTEVARRSGIAPRHSDTVRATSFRAITFLAVATWAIATLDGFLLFDPLVAAVRRGLDWKITVGAFSIDPGDLLIFGLIIWLSFKTADFVQFVLNVDLMPRVDLPRGVPETISRLSRYVMIAVGAVVASAAAGFDISKITIVLGALGVGVGFGLQNIVNNFVSGLILLFERPIRVGDTLSLDDTGGTVERIGLRASIVSTWDGAEIIVPNARLISEDVVNWTLTHDRRRVEISVGVAYGTDPEKAAQLIVDVARNHDDVDAHPEPACFFMGLGESALELQLFAWTAASKFLGVASDLRAGIVRKLGEAGIEIPLPQRDVHVRHSDPRLEAPSDRSPE
jgi:small-conductance mechanosensitive channel